LRFPQGKKAQFVTEMGITKIGNENSTGWKNFADYIFPLHGRGLEICSQAPEIPPQHPNSKL
jgi:hypothetical protein